MTTLLFAWRALAREWRSGELRVLAVALAVAVASVSAVGFFTDRVRKAMEHQAGELLAADLVVESNDPIEPAWVRRAEDLDLATAQTVAFRSVVLAGGEVQLTEVKAVDSAYPLRGELRIADQPFGLDRARTGGPERGHAWAEPRLLQELAVEPGSRVRLGELGLALSGVVAFEPDRGGAVFSIGPRLMINLDDLPKSGLLQTGSLADYRLLVAGSPDRVAQFADSLRGRLDDGQRLIGVREARPELTSAMQRAERFLGLAALVSVLLAGVAVATASRRYARRHLDSSAIMRCLGASERFVATSHLLKLIGLGIAGSLVGVGLGYLAQDVLGRFAGDLFASDLPAPSGLPVLHGLLTGLVTLAGFGLPPLLALKNVPPLRVLRRDVAPAPPSALSVYGGAVGTLFVLTLWQVGEWRLTALVFGGALGALALMSLIAWGLVVLLRGIRRGGVAWRFGLANIARRRGASVAQVVAFGLGIMVLLLLSLVRSELLAGWQESLPPDAPNNFLINVLPDQVDPLRKFLSERGRPDVEIYPMVRARLAAINGKPVSAAKYDNPRAKRLARRTFNLSWSRTVPEANSVSQGSWWRADVSTGQWSVAERLANRLGIDTGDTLEFRVAGEAVSGVVSGLRKVEWDSFRVNFFVLAAPGMIENYAPTYITSFFIPAHERKLLPELVERFPNVTVIDVDAVMRRVRTIIDRVVLAVEFVFLFTLAAGLTVLYATIQSTHDERLREAAILRTLGARNGQVAAALAAEFLALGLLSGLLAAAAAVTTGYLLAHQIFGFAYTPGWAPWVAGAVGGAAGVGIAGLAGTRRVLAQPPLWTLRRT